MPGEVTCRMSRLGLELSGGTSLQGNDLRERRPESAAQSGAVTIEPFPISPELDGLVAGWHGLPLHVRQDILRRAQAARQGTAVAPSAGTSFPDRFDRAFAELDRQGGGRNRVSLAQLRMTLGTVSRETFDREMRELQKVGQYALVAVVDGQIITEEERAAGIKKGKELLLYVARQA
jgi:hypothetical protein